MRSNEPRRARAHRSEVPEAGSVKLTGRRRRGPVIALVILAAFLVTFATAIAAGGAEAASPKPAAGHAAGSVTPHAVTVSLKWERLLGSNTQIVLSSPNIATLDSQGKSVVVGSRGNGCVYAVQLSSGATTPGWPKCTDAGIDSTPAVYSPDGGYDNVYVTTGDVPGQQPPVYNENCGSDLADCIGTLYAYGPSGNMLWARYLPDKFSSFGPHPMLAASPAIGSTSVSAAPSIVVGGISASLYSMNPVNGDVNAGWPQKTADTTFATAAISNVDSAQRIIAASDSTAGSGALNNWDGGSVRSMNSNGGTNWTAASNEVVTSSPAVGNLNGSGPVVAYGHGRYWNGSDDDALTVDNAATGALEWKQYLGGYTRASPALADLTGNGQLDVVEPTWTALGKSTGGTVWAFSPTGGKLWGPVSVGDTTIAGGVATADFGSGYQDVVVATGDGWRILDGRTGSTVTTQGVDIEWPGQDHANLAMSNTPLVTPDPSGDGLDVVVAGTYGGGSSDNTQGFIADYHVTGGTDSTGSGSWPQFHDNPQLTGTTIAPATLQVGCDPNRPPCSLEGYWLSASDGGIFAFGKAAYMGSMGGKRLNAPVVGMAATEDKGGYWEVASDGGIFTFGNARFYGSMGGKRLYKPVVGMASTPNGGGYWEVASDGGVFTFGDARFYGSMGGKRLNAPVVGIAATPDGGGYWEVASDGGVFTFGDARFYGSMGGKRLYKPVVGIAATSNGAGYWEVASDGGVFTFGDARFDGSMGGKRLNKPVVGISATTGGGGYWEVAADGGIFTFGDAYFRGSTGGIILNKPVEGMASVGP